MIATLSVSFSSLARRAGILGLVLPGLLLASVDTASAQAGGQRIRGTITAIEGAVLVVKSMEGEELKVTLPDTVTVGTVAKATPADITPGTYVGAGAKPQKDGTLKAVQVIIFPEAQRGTGEGHRDSWILPDSSMTNATVGDNVATVDGASMTLTYKGGQKKLVIGPDAALLKSLPAQRSDLKPGAAVLVSVTKAADGTLSAARITVATGGVPLPM